MDTHFSRYELRALLGAHGPVELEENGYDISYISGRDAATNGSLLLHHKIFMDTGHDEYWTDVQMANVQAAANAGVNLAFQSGNEIFWKTRLAPSTDRSAIANRTLVSYKDTLLNHEVDPSGTATGTFQDPRLGSPQESSNQLTGTLFQVDGGNTDSSVITIPYGDTLLRFWRNTSVANTTPGQTSSLESDLLGYEWDPPPGLIDLSSTTVQEASAYNTDWGTSRPLARRPITWRSTATRRAARLSFWGRHDNSPSPYSSQSTDPNV